MLKTIKLIISIFICQLAGFIGSFFTRVSVDTWYKNLTKPFFNPPNWVFSPVWITLYFLMGVSFFLIWTKDLYMSKKKKALSIFLIQLIFNTIWSMVFFGLKNIYLSVVVIIALWFLILFTILEFYKISKVSAFLLVPYILWVSFAGILNASILLLNI
jgi:tryptophan-rich sensory protein